MKRRLGLGVAALLVLAACSSGGSDGTATSKDGSTTTAASARSTTTAQPGDCAWPTKADEATLNVAYPDTSATYWAMPYRLEPGERLHLTGTFPAARYFSFITYGPEGGAIDVLTDRDVIADDGSTNPFADGGKAGGGYAIDVADATTAAPNTVDVSSADDGSTGVVTGTVIYRVYLSVVAGDPTGGGGLPGAAKVAADGSVTEIAPCAEPGPNPKAKALVAKNGPATDKPAPSQPVFIRPEAGVANLYPNPDNTYIATILAHTPGRVVVVQGTSPSFPDTGSGESVTGGEQVRYWSLCTNEYRKPYPVSSCVADQDVALDAEGRYTIVVSTKEDRPASASADGAPITWLDWGSTKVDDLLLMRQMLASPDFTEAAANLEPGALASSGMGPYAPVGRYCSVESFEAAGPAACTTD